MKTLPIATLRLKDLSNTKLLTIAFKIYNDLYTAPGSTNYPTPPIPQLTFAGLLNAFRLSLAAARKGSKAETATKNAARDTIISAMRELLWYINTTSNAVTINNGPALSASEASILTSGFYVKNQQTKKVGPMPLPIIRSMVSPEIGQLKIILQRFSKAAQRNSSIRGVKVFVVKMRTAAAPGVPAGPWIDTVFANSRILFTGLVSGTYDIQIYAKGADQVSALTTIQPVVIL